MDDPGETDAERHPIKNEIGTVVPLMKKSALRALQLIVLVAFVAQGEEERGRSTAYEEALQEYSMQGERLDAFAEQHWDDAQTLLGLAVLYDTYGPPRPPVENQGVPVGSWGVMDPNKMILQERIGPAERLYKRVLGIEPHNRPAWAALARIRAQYYTGTCRMWLEELDAVVRYAKERNLEEFRIPSSILRKLLGERRHYDLDSLKEEVEKRLAERERTVLELLGEGQARDPNNALYNYLRAHIRYATGDSEGGFQELERGAQKPFWNNYPVEADAARAKVLHDAKLPSMLKRRLLHADFLVTTIRPELRSTEEASDRRGDKATAAKVDEIFEAMARHIRNEPRPYENPVVEGIADAFENHVKERRRALNGVPAPIRP